MCTIRSNDKELVDIKDYIAKLSWTRRIVIGFTVAIMLLFFIRSIDWNTVDAEQLSVRLSDNQLSVQLDDEPYSKRTLLTSQFLLFDTLSEATPPATELERLVRANVKVTRQGRTIYYLNQYSLKTGSGILSMVSVSQQSGKLQLSKPTIIAKDVKEIAVDRSGKLIVYLQLVDDTTSLIALYDHNDFEIERGVEAFQLSSNGKSLIYYTIDVLQSVESPRYSLYFRDLSSLNASKLIDTGIIEWVPSQDSLEFVTYSKVNPVSGPFDVYRAQPHLNDRPQLIVNQVRAVVADGRSNAFYYLRDTIEQVSLDKLVEDDLTADNSAAVNELRVKLAQSTTYNTTTRLYYFDGKQSSDALEQNVQAVVHTNSKLQSVVFRKQLPSPALKLSNFKSIDQIYKAIDDANTQPGVVYLRFPSGTTLEARDVTPSQASPERFASVGNTILYLHEDGRLLLYTGANNELSEKVKARNLKRFVYDYEAPKLIMYPSKLTRKSEVYVPYAN